MSDFCYIDYATGESDHMNGHIRTSKCDKPREATVSAPATYTLQQMARKAQRLEIVAEFCRNDSDDRDHLFEAAAMLRQAAAEGQGNETPQCSTCSHRVAEDNCGDPIEPICGLLSFKSAMGPFHAVRCAVVGNTCGAHSAATPTEPTQPYEVAK